MMLVRVYVTESRANLDRVLSRLKDAHMIRGMTVYRGIAGFGSTETVDHDAPLVLEFFDKKSAVDQTVRYLRTLMAPHHVVALPVDVVYHSGGG